ncbi:hypothetical protein [uncultured Microbacterium sp.]|uniref:hypothetical protein n=1 Tax=uncultured Microbacterium sp. TaxID=191216 RepID=UPI0028E4BB80|nr:hypothetical protein [uncultured Microbacterium sp.]
MNAISPREPGDGNFAENSFASIDRVSLMGKSARDGNTADTLRQQERLLSDLTGMIAKLWGTRAECVEAAALFVATADRLGIPVQARAVSILAIDTQEHRVSMTGIAAGADAERRLGATVFGAPEDVSDSSFERAGHMILTSNALSMIFDPTFQQFSKDGLPAISLSGPVSEVRPESGELVIEFGGERFEVTYFFDDDNVGWQQGFEWAKTQWGDVADRLTSELMAGTTAATMNFEIPWEEQPAH